MAKKEYIYTKSNENIQFVKELFNQKSEKFNWHIIGGRLYYSVYQRMKSLLVEIYDSIIDDKDMQKYLKENRTDKLKSKSIPHGYTALGIIIRAIEGGILNITGDVREGLKTTTGRLDALIVLRLCADYEHGHNRIDKKQIEKHLKYAEDISKELDLIYW